MHKSTQTLAGLSDWQPALVLGASSRARRCYLRKFFSRPLFPGREDGFESPRLLVAKDPCLGNVSFPSNFLSGGLFGRLVVQEMRVAQPVPLGSLQSVGLGTAASWLEHPHPLHGVVEVGWERPFLQRKWCPAFL